MPLDRPAARRDPADSGIAPDRALVERALRVAQVNLARTPRDDIPNRDYWAASVAALRWALGETTHSPLRGLLGRVDLEASRGTVADEAAYAYRCIAGTTRPPAHVRTLGHLSGVEHTLSWVSRGTGFAAPLTDEALRLAGIAV